MNLLIEFIKINKALKAKKLSGKEFLAFEEYQRVCVEDIAGSANCTQRFSILFSYLDFCFLSFRILQNNLLHLYLVKSRRYKLSFFAKPATNSLRISQFSKKYEANNPPGSGTSQIYSCAFSCAKFGDNRRTRKYSKVWRIYFVTGPETPIFTRAGDNL